MSAEPELTKVEQHLQQLAARIRTDRLAHQRGEASRDAWLETAAAIGSEMADIRAAVVIANSSHGLRSGKAAILAYLRLHVGEPVHAHRLEGVSGIGEWARRVRELRVEAGWPIDSTLSDPRLPDDHYRLNADEPDAKLAEAWRLAKEVRNTTGSGKDRLLRYLKAVCPAVVDKERLSYVSNIQEWPRRMRELEEEGWKIVSNVDDSSLAPGSYYLEDLAQRPPRVRQAIKQRHAILERDGKRCRDCGDAPDKNGVVLHIHHILPVHLGGKNDDDNLVTLCRNCHAGRHSSSEFGVHDELLHPEHEPDPA
ncbi:HNH endonuclease [Streptomyces venezuelae]|uniref:HNH endonuclease n=1 Tax=Streptomyces venezuelae TaxID=54571 RepID=UPI00278C72AE|nr:HNH endonuclease [Streptomyces venezuelae]